MRKEVAGFIIAGVLITVALAVYGCSHVRFEKKESDQTTTSAMNTTTTGVVDDSVAKTEMSAQQSTMPTVTTTVADNSSSVAKDDGKSLIKITNEDKLDYSGNEQVTSGKVTSRECFIDGTQVVYLLGITISMGTKEQEVSYYCTYSTYSSVAIDDVLSVTYKSTTDSTFAVIEVSR